jgi:hypothetical protein
MTTFGLRKGPQLWLKAVIGAALALAMVPAQGRCDSYSIFCLLIELAKPQKPHHDCCHHNDSCCDDDCVAEEDGCTHSPCCPHGVCTGAQTMPCCPKPCAACDKACASPDKPCGGCDKKCCESGITPAGACTPGQGVQCCPKSCAACDKACASTDKPCAGCDNKYCENCENCPVCQGKSIENCDHCKAAQQNNGSCSGCPLCRGNKPVSSESTGGCQATLEKQAQELRRLCGEHQRTIQELEAIVMELCQEISLLRQDIQSIRHEERSQRFVFHHDERLRFASQYMVQPEEAVPASYRGFWISEESIALPPNNGSCGSFWPVQIRWAVPPPMVVYPPPAPGTSVPMRGDDN